MRAIPGAIDRGEITQRLEGDRLLITWRPSRRRLPRIPGVARLPLATACVAGVAGLVSAYVGSYFALAACLLVCFTAGRRVREAIRMDRAESWLTDEELGDL